MTDRKWVHPGMKRGDMIKLEPTWKGVLPLLLVTYRDGSDKGRQTALEELRRMAEAADRWNASIKEETPAE